MTRILALTVGGATVCFGFSLPFLVAGGSGLLAGLVAVVAGSALIWYAEQATRDSLRADTAWNRLMKADGEELLGKEVRAPDANRSGPLVLVCIALASAALAWLGSVIHDSFGRLWLVVFDLCVIGTIWIVFRALRNGK